MVLRTTISSSRLVRVLGRWHADAPPAPREDVAERLGAWLPVRGAITLDAAHRAIQGLPATAAARRTRIAATGTGAVVAALEQELQKVRETLVQAIAAAPVAPPRRRGRHPLAPAAGVVAAPVEPDAEPQAAALRQRCTGLQRQMELRIDALRAHVRQQLGHCTPALAQLAALDAAMQQAFAERTDKALAALPALLERRCAALQGTASADRKAREQALQELLLAELETRLEPVTGLIEAGRSHADPAAGVGR